MKCIFTSNNIVLVRTVYIDMDTILRIKRIDVVRYCTLKLKSYTTPNAFVAYSRLKAVPWPIAFHIHSDFVMQYPILNQNINVVGESESGSGLLTVYTLLTRDVDRALYGDFL